MMRFSQDVKRSSSTQMPMSLSRFHSKAAFGLANHGTAALLSYLGVMCGSLDGEDGHNVVLHEFAHKLDEENLTTNGMPILRNREQYASWVEVLNKEYEEFLNRVDRKKNKVIDEYGAVSPPEFFAVATEYFFEKGPIMAARLPELYKQLQDYYSVDPASW